MRKLIGPQTGNLAIYCTDASISRYLKARNWNVKKAVKMLKATLKWREEFKPEEICWVIFAIYILRWNEDSWHVSISTHWVSALPLSLWILGCLCFFSMLAMNAISPLMNERNLFFTNVGWYSRRSRNRKDLYIELQR